MLCASLHIPTRTHAALALSLTLPTHTQPSVPCNRMCFGMGSVQPQHHTRQNHMRDAVLRVLIVLSNDFSLLFCGMRENGDVVLHSSVFYGIVDT